MKRWSFWNDKKIHAIQKQERNENCCRLFYVQAQHVNGTTDAVTEEDLWSRAESLVIFGFCQRRKGVRFAKDTATWTLRSEDRRDEKRKQKTVFSPVRKLCPRRGRRFRTGTKLRMCQQIVITIVQLNAEWSMKTK